MSVRVGIDVGGTFTDLVAVDPATPARFARARSSPRPRPRPAGSSRGSRRWRPMPARSPTGPRSSPTPSWRAARLARRSSRRVASGTCSRSRGRAVRALPAGRPATARTARATAPPVRGDGAGPGRRPGEDAPRGGRAARTGGRAAGQRRPGRGGLPPPCLRASGARGALAGGARGAGPIRLRLARDQRRVPGVRAELDDGAERGRDADRRPVPEGPGSLARPRRGPGDAPSPPVERRDDVGGGCAPAPPRHGGVGARRAASRRRASWRRRSGSATRSPSTWGGPPPTSA